VAGFAVQVTPGVRQCVLKAWFAAGTPLLTPDGSKPIEEIRIGDLVLSRPEGDVEAPVQAMVVQEVFVRTGQLWVVGVGGREIGTTAEHPFFVQGKGWVAAGELQEGDLISTHEGRWVAAEGVEDTGEYGTVYNLRVAEYHTYFVGCQEWGWSVWAHNRGGGCGDGYDRASQNRAAEREIQDQLRTTQGMKRQQTGGAGLLSGLPRWLQRLIHVTWAQGNNFNRSREPYYTSRGAYNEVYVNDPVPGNPHNRVDSDDPVRGEIVSRKFTQFSEILPGTGIGYVSELPRKYGPGTVIVDVPTNRPGTGNGLAGQTLTGQMFLEVPVQAQPIPQQVLNAAQRHNVIIRDVNGTVY
jgi:hypothetical protein